MGSDNGPGGRVEMVLSVSDQPQLASLRDWLRSQRDAEVVLRPGSPGTAEQGALDVVTILASSSGLVTAIRILPEFIRSRRSGFRIQTVVRGEEFVLDAANVADVMAILERLLGD